MKKLGISLAAMGMVLAACSKSETDSKSKRAPAPAKKAKPVTKLPGKKPAKTPLHSRAPWHQGTVEAAMAAAKQQGKPIFLYWGAVWCPPCNAIKAAVFSKPEFAGAMTKFVSVYLDGDTERAQAWGDKLSVSGYPTLLFLAPDGREISRSSAGLTWSEFVALKDSVLARMKPLEDVVALAKAGKAKPGDWKLLASVDGYGLETRGRKPAEALELLSWIAGAVPADLPGARAAAAGNLLAAAATTKDKAAAKLVAEVRAKADKYLATVFASDASIMAARETILSYSAEVVGFAARDDSARTRWSDKWLAAARKLRKRQDLPVVTRMLTLYPEVELFRLRQPKGEVPGKLRTLVTQQVGILVAKLKSSYQYRAGVYYAISLLRKVGALDKARRLLDAVLKTTSTPWYFMSTYASLEKAAGNDKAALEWARKARLAAKGPATKLQWIANDLTMTTGAKGGVDKQRLAELVKVFYDKLLSLPDGFKGRNHRVAKRVGKKLRASGQRDALKGVLAGYAARCAKVPAAQRDACNKYFAELLANKKS